MALKSRVLIVDDDAMVRAMLAHALESLGHETVGAGNGQEALSLISPQIDLVLLDMRMPGLDGCDVVRLIRQSGETADVPIIMVTGETTRQDRLRAVEAGANDFMAKPVDMTELRVRTESQLRIKQAQDAERRYRSELEATVAERTSELVAARERAEAASRAKTVFQAMMSTELLSPVRTLTAAAQALDERCRREGLAEIGQEADHLTELSLRIETMVVDVLDFASVESDRVTVERERFNLGELVQAVAQQFEPVARRRGNRIEIGLNGGDHEIISDRYKVERALAQLVANACKFTEQGTIALTVEIGPQDRPGAAVIRVADTGPGMTEEEARRSFEEFWQAAPGSAGRGGTGLGLTIARHFARVLGGDVTVQSRPGSGTVFSLIVASGLEPNSQVHPNS